MRRETFWPYKLSYVEKADYEFWSKYGGCREVRGVPDPR